MGLCALVATNTHMRVYERVRAGVYVYVHVCACVWLFVCVCAYENLSMEMYKE